MNDAAVSVETTPTQAPPQEMVETGQMTEGERLYFRSRGQDTSGLTIAPKAEEPAAAKVPPAEQKKTEEPSEPTEDGEILVEDGGQVRDKKTGRFVPITALHREREKAKAASAEAQALRDNLLRTRERLEIMTEVLPKAEQAKVEAAQQSDPEPDPEQDMIAWMKWSQTRQKTLQAKIDALEGATAKQREAQTLQSYFTSDIAEFQKSAPDFTDALNYGIAVREKMYTALGVPQEQIRNRVLGEISELIRDSHGSKLSAAQRLYETAKALGYTAKPTQQVDAKKATEDAEAEIKRITEAQKTHKTLGSGGSTSPSDILTAERLANMPEGEYSKARAGYIAKHGSKAWNDLLSGRR